jgi:monofunctional biosynthetic peptidoglycan transglycosylase
MTRKSVGMRLLRWVSIAVAVLITLCLLVILLFRFVNPPTSAFMVGYQMQRGATPISHHWVPLSGISSWMPLAVVASEDQRFPEHWGVDFQAIRQAVSEYRAGEGLRGASTITQQTAKNLFLWNDRSFVRKGLEAGFALVIDAFWPKQRVLEVYLNIAEFGPGIYGVEAASRAYFGKSARSLSAYEAASLAAVLPNPKVLSVRSPSSYVQDRVDWILGQMAQLGRGYLANL